MAPRQGAKKSSTVEVTGVRVAKIFKLAHNIIDPTDKVRFKSLLNRDNKKDACTLRDPSLGLTLLQIAVIADNVPAAEELIAQGADVGVTVSHQQMQSWTGENAPTKLSQRGPESFWMHKMMNLCLLQTAPEAINGSIFGLMHLAVFGGSIDAVRFLVSKGHADVNALAANTGLTPLMCVALCANGPNRRTTVREPSRNIVDALLELGGDLSRVNPVGNDFVAIAASAWDRGMWEDIIADPVLLSKCTSKHAGRVALQLFATWICDKNRPTDTDVSQAAKVWCAEMKAMTAAWCRAEPQTQQLEVQKRIAKELSEPITQRIMRDEVGSRITDAARAFLAFWPPETHAITNILCAIMQSIGIPPIKIDLPMLETKRMLLQLFSMGVKPAALLLPQRPDQGKCKLCALSSLQALIDILLMDTKHGSAQFTGHDLAQYKKVLMDQLWCYFYTNAKHPTMDLQKHPSQIDNRHLGQLLQMLNTCGVDWADPSAWPEDCVDGKWERQIPIPFLLENIGPGRTASMRIITAMCDELAALGNTAFVNAHHPEKPAPLVYAAYGGHSEAILAMIKCGGSPVRQGSDWKMFFVAATCLFRPHMALLLQHLMNMKALLAGLQAWCRSATLGLHKDDSPNTCQCFIKQLVGNHQGFEAILLPLIGRFLPPSAMLLHQQCQLALAAPKNDMGAVLEILLTRGNQLHLAKDEGVETLAAALVMRDAKSGVTLLGQAVAWGYDEAITPILDAVRKCGVDLSALLDCHTEESKFHKPLFAAVVYGYDNIVSSILDVLSLRHTLPAALFEHVVTERISANPRASPAKSRRFVAEPGGGAETIDLLMCAASAGSVSTTQILIDCGVSPRDTQRFRRNRFYKSAMYAAVEYPDLAMLMWEGGSSASQGVEGMGGLLPGTKQMRCVNLLLKAGAAMTERQLTIIINALPTLEDPTVASSTWCLLTKHVSACARCNLIGCWSRCQRCRTAPYCSAKCQRKHWPKHRMTCKPVKSSGQRRK